MDSCICTTCFRESDLNEIKQWDNKQVCYRCYFKYVKYSKLDTNLTTDERKKIIEQLYDIMDKKD